MRKDYVNFGHVAISRLSMQCQYACRYADKVWSEDYPFLAEGLRIDGNSNNYHDMMIHKDDVETFVQRVQDYRSKMGW